MKRDESNFKYIQWHRLDYMQEEMLREVDRRCEGKESIAWRNYSAVQLDRMSARIRRALNSVEYPDFQ